MKNNVRIMRLAKNLTQKELADLIGVTRQTISLIEKGDYNPSLKLCLKICYALDQGLDDLFWMDQEVENDEGDSR